MVGVSEDCFFEQERQRETVGETVTSAMVGHMSSSRTVVSWYGRGRTRVVATGDEEGTMRWAAKRAWRHSSKEELRFGSARIAPF